MIEHLIEERIEILLSMVGGNLWFMPVMAFLVGLLTSLTPCSLAGIPIIINYVSGTKSNKKRKAFALSLVFAAGMALVYTILGVFASVLGGIFHNLGLWWYFLLSGVTVLMALQMLSVINIFPESLGQPSSKRKGYTGAFIAGMLGGLFASHCALPALVVLLAIAAEKSTVAQGAFMLLLFAIGHSVFVVIAGTWTAVLEKMTKNRKYDILLKVVKVSIGLGMLILAAYLIFAGFNSPH
jgi:cytochrome c biogenesis protein CcdA